MTLGRQGCSRSFSAHDQKIIYSASAHDQKIIDSAHDQKIFYLILFNGLVASPLVWQPQNRAFGSRSRKGPRMYLYQPEKF
jgi:hypothetical protein